MKTVFSIFLFVTFLNSPTIAEIRKAYPKAADSESSAIAFASKFTTIAAEDKVLLAYKGASVTMVAKFKKKVSEKITTFKEGAKLIEAAVAATFVALDVPDIYLVAECPVVLGHLGKSRFGQRG